jgi:hypothetical protein
MPDIFIVPLVILGGICWFCACFRVFDLPEKPYSATFTGGY